MRDSIILLLLSLVTIIISMHLFTSGTLEKLSRDLYYYLAVDLILLALTGVLYSTFKLLNKPTKQ